MVEPLRMYQGPKQEKHFRKRRQLLQREQIVEALSSDEHKQLGTVSVSKTGLDIPRISVPAIVKSNWPLIILAYSLGIVTLGVNASVAWDRGSSLKDKVLLAVLFFILEAMVFFLPNQASSLWQQRQRLNSGLTWIVFLPLFAFAVYNSQGFASQNYQETTTVRAERITPAVADAQRKLDGLSSYRDAECVKVGDKCRQAVKDVQAAFESLEKVRQTVSATADPQIASAAKLVSWVSVGQYNPTQDDFANLRLLLLTILPQLGGLVLMVAKRA